MLTCRKQELVTCYSDSYLLHAGRGGSRRRVFKEVYNAPQ